MSARDILAAFVRKRAIPCPSDDDPDAIYFDNGHAREALEALTAAGYRILAPGERDAERILQNLDPENAIDDSLLREIHRRLQVHGEKYPERAVSVLHRNVVLYTIQAAIRTLTDGGEK